MNRPSRQTDDLQTKRLQKSEREIELALRKLSETLANLAEKRRVNFEHICLGVVDSCVGLEEDVAGMCVHLFRRN